MGSQSDWSTLRHTGKILKELKIVHEKKIVSAHRTPKRLYEYAEQAYDRGIKIIIAGAGGSASFTRHDSSYNSYSSNRGTN